MSSRGVVRVDEIQDSRIRIELSKMGERGEYTRKSGEEGGGGGEEAALATSGEEVVGGRQRRPA